MPIIDWRCNAIEKLDHNPELLKSPLGRCFLGVNNSSRNIMKISPPDSVELAIIGGGVIGCAIACQILRYIPSLRSKMAILDSQSLLVQNFFDYISATGQRVMRSPYEHQIAPDGNLQMLDFARLHFSQLTDIEKKQTKIALSGQRSVVPVDIFKAHTTHIIGVYELNKLAYRFKVKSIQSDDEDSWIIRGDNNSNVKAKAVIIATGNQAVNWDDTLLKYSHQFKDSIQSGYDQKRQIKANERVAVIGSGLTAAHIILQIIEAKGYPIWILRNEEKYRCADFDTAYFRSEGISRFRKLSIQNRAKLLEEENRGSLMLEFVSLFEELENKRYVEVFRNSKIEHIFKDITGKININLLRRKKIQVNKIIVATGLTPNTQLLPDETRLIDKKYVNLNEDTLEIEGLKNFFVVGSLASLVLGPAAKNIDGARLASEKILPVLEKQFHPNYWNGSVALSSKINGFTPIKLANM